MTEKAREMASASGSGVGNGQCNCELCRIGRALRADPMDRLELEAGFNWLMEGGCERDMEMSHLLRAVADYTRQHDAPELVEALRLISPAHAGVEHPDYRPPPRRRIVYAATFVDGYADLTGKTLPEAREAFRKGGGEFHLAVARADHEAQPEPDSGAGD